MRCTFERFLRVVFELVSSYAFHNKSFFFWERSIPDSTIPCSEYRLCLQRVFVNILMERNVTQITYSVFPKCGTLGYFIKADNYLGSVAPVTHAYAAFCFDWEIQTAGGSDIDRIAWAVCTPQQFSKILAGSHSWLLTCLSETRMLWNLS